MLQFIGLLILCLSGADCFRWDSTFGDSVVNANATGEVIIAFRFIPGSENPSDTNLLCGYVDESVTFHALVEKKGLSSPRELNPNVPISSRASVYTDPKEANVLGIKLTNIQKNDPQRFRCRASFVNQGGQTIESDIKILTVLERPKFVNCLTSLPIKNEGDDLSIECLVSGNPKPYLRCDVLSYTGEVLPGKTVPVNSGVNGKAQNITKSDGIFRTIPKEADAVRCRAFQELTGEAIAYRKLIVRHKPFKPRNFSQISSPDATSIRIRWREIPNNETGEDFDGYRVYYYVDRLGAGNKTDVELSPQPGNVNPNYMLEEVDGERFLIYTIRSLGRNLQYRVWVLGFNDYGEGDSTLLLLLNPGANPFAAPKTGSDDDNLPAIIGGVVAGVVFLVLIVILIVWLSRRSSPTTSKYPTSYVEDAVDYPPNQGHSLYADVGKSRNSSSNYPDVVNDGSNGYAMRHTTSSSYEQSDKAYV